MLSKRGVYTTEDRLTRRYHDFVKFLLESAAVGVAAGLVAVGFRLALERADTLRNAALGWAHAAPGWGWLVFPVLAAAAAGIAGWLTHYAPETAGSGIPHVEAVLGGERYLSWGRVIGVKFAAGTLALGSGLSLGREGPTVQMGAAAGQAVSRALRRPRAEQLQLIACGAGAGLAAAFNAPLAGVIFVVEELRRNFSPYVLGGALAASATADIVSLWILGPLPTFRVASLTALPLTALPLVLALGAVTGLFGHLFNETLVRSLRLADRLGSLPRWFRAALVAFVAGLLGYVLPHVLGGGHALVVSLLRGEAGHTLFWLAVLFGAKFLLTMVSYSVGVPGGIFLPLLTLGALLGASAGEVGRSLFPAVEGLVPSFIIIGMAAYFVAIVRAPLTGIVLITEMTGRYQHMLPLLLACVTAYVVAEALGSLPVYESLLERQLRHGARRPDISVWGGTAVLELAIESGAPAAGRRVRELDLPEECLLVAVVRGSREELPRGATRLHEGDVLRVLVPEEQAGFVQGTLRELASCRFEH